MSTRAASAAKSRLAKQRLFNLLFGQKRNNPVVNNKGKDLHIQNNDCASFSYNDLRRAYLERIQDIHPDKYLHHKRRNDKKNDTRIHNNNNNNNNNNNAKAFSSLPLENHSQILEGGKDQRIMEGKIISNLKNEFIELQEAWINYENIAKEVKKVGKIDADFTMFGVGCSFSDSPEETLRRSEIMDQAGRGWFTAGLISETNSANPKSTTTKTKISLTDDDLFVNTSKVNIARNNKHDDNVKEFRKPKSLIDHVHLKRMKKN